MFFTQFGVRGAGLPRDTQPAYAVLGSSKVKTVQTNFFDIVITWNDHPRYVKHVLARVHVATRTLF